MAFVTGLIATLFLAGYLRGRRVKALMAIAGAGLSGTAGVGGVHLLHLPGGPGSTHVGSDCHSGLIPVGDDCGRCGLWCSGAGADRPARYLIPRGVYPT